MENLNWEEKLFCFGCRKFVLNKSLLPLIVFVATSFVAPISYADMFTPSQSCPKPWKPYEFEDEWTYQRFLDDVENYKRCINNFVDEQNDEARKHLEAAEDAVDEWNNYVNYELK